MRTVAVVCSVLLGAACSRGVDSEALGIRYQPPSGMKLLSEERGPPAIAHFENGLELRAFPSPLSVDSPAEALQKVRAEVPGLPEKVVSARPGTLPAGKVARWELDGGKTRTLVYAVDGGARHFLVTLTAPTRDYDRLANRLERSLSTLEPR